ncbi:MAG: ABC transporter ATP-binding protein [Eubacteriaceae bacterium]|jgi:putative ABC transport system ATP-binding protein|nr:ABC transporter ATP-binding protein [Eubacteriaceae bacterium]MDD4508000.1 ABC transporter ATP-binding protein [Eubacteriaceae bacterium]
MIETKGLRFLESIEYPDVAIADGQTTFIVGESGSGKSSLLRLFNGTQKPSAGKVLYNGEDIAGMDTIALRRQVLLADQTVWLFDGSIEDNFEKFYAYRDVHAPEKEEMQRYLKLCQLDFDVTAPTAPMSGGEKQRVFLAVFLSFRPQVLMFDEPTSALDEGTAERLIAEIRQEFVDQGHTLIVVSHDKALAKRHADHIVTIGSSIPGGEVHE